MSDSTSGEQRSESASLDALDQVVRYFEWALQNVALLARPKEQVQVIVQEFLEPESH